MSRKSLIKLFIAVLVICLFACILVACKDNTAIYKPGDVVVDEKDVTWTVDTDGNVVIGEYQGKDIVVKYLLDNASYLVLSGKDYDDMHITGYHGDIKSFSVKSIEDKVEINDKKISVTAIEDNTFRGCETLESVDLTKSSKALSFEVGSNAFAYCTSLTSVTLPDNMYVNDNEIGENAFDHCEALTNINLGDKFTVINKSAFAYCTSLEKINLPSTIRGIADYTFIGCKKLTALNFIPNENNQTVPDLKSIGNYAFANTAIDDGNFSKFTKLRAIGNYAFAKTEISALTIPDNVSIIGVGAFLNCENLVSVNIPFLGTTVLSQSGWTFYSTYGCTTDSDDDSATRSLSVRVRGTMQIPAYAFENCKDIETISIGYFDIEKNPSVKIYGLDGITFTEYEDLETYYNDTVIGSNTFKGCSNLKSLDIADNIETIGNNAFEGCEKLKDFDFLTAVKSIGSYAFRNTGLTSFTIPSTLHHSEIGVGILADCTKLESVTIEDYDYAKLNETNISYEYETFGTLSRLFAENTVLKLDDYNTNGDTSFIDSENFPLYLATTGFQGVFVPKSLKTVKLGSVTKLIDSAFSGFKSLTAIEIEWDDNLSDYNFSNGYKQLYPSIGAYAFQNCEKLSNFDIAADVKLIGSYAFLNTGLTSFTIPSTLPYSAIGTGILADCTKLESVTIKDYDYAQRNGSNYNYDYVTFGALSRLFANNTTLNTDDLSTDDKSFPLYKVTSDYTTSVWVPKTLKTVKLGDVTLLSANAFSGFTSLTAIEIEWANNLYNYDFNNYSSEQMRPTIGTQAFANCTNLTTLTFTGVEINPQNIKSGAFKNCESLEKLPVALPLVSQNSLIYGLAEGCTGLKEISVVLPESTFSLYIANLFASSVTNSNNLLNEDYRKLKKVVLVSLTTSNIPENLLNGAENIKEIVFDTNLVVRMGKNAFTNTSITTSATDYLITYNNWVIGAKTGTSFAVIPTTILGIANDALPSNILHIFYEGTYDEWYEVHYGNTIEVYNRQVYFYSAEEPLYSGNYWHYVDDAIEVYGGAVYGSVTFTLNYGNGTTETCKIESPNMLTEDNVNLPVIEGKRFAGWYLDTSKTIPVELPYDGSNGRTLYADWKDLTRYSIVIKDDLTLTAWADGDLTTADMPNTSSHNFVITALYSDADKTNRVFLPYGDTTILYAQTEELKVYEIIYPSSYPFSENNGVYTSTNQNKSESTSYFTIKVNVNATVSFDYSVSSESNYDYIYIEKLDEHGTSSELTSRKELSGNKSGTLTYELNAGESLRIKYIKDNSTNGGTDTATISNLIVTANY